MAETKIKSPLERDYWFDNIKAFLIICVFVGHLANGTFSTTTWWVIALQNFIYVFHMPAFMVVSGRFAKKRVDRGDWTTVVTKMVVPYIIYQTAFLVLFSALKATPSKFSYFSPLFGLWYFINVAVYTIATTHLKKFKWLFPASIIAALAVGFCLGTLYGGFHRIVCFYPFFLFGYYTAEMKFDFCKKIPFRIICLLMFGAIGLYVLLNYKYKWNVISWDLLCMNKTYRYVAQAKSWSLLQVLDHTILRYIFGFLGFFMVLGLMPTKKTFFSYVGTHSVYVYVLHCAFIIVLRQLDEDYDLLRVLTDKWRLLIYCFSGVPLSFILASKPMRKLTGWFISPKFDLSKALRKLTGIDK